MLRKSIFTSLWLAAAACAWAGSINFTPHPESSYQDGTAIPRVWFTAPTGKISIRALRDWRIVGTSEELRVESKTFREAEARVENVSKGPAPDFDEAGLEKYRALAKSLMPPQAEDVQLLGEKLDAVPINDWHALAVTYGFRLTGRSFIRQIIFLKLDANLELRLTVDALKDDASKFQGQIHGMLNSWLETPAGGETSNAHSTQSLPPPRGAS